MREGIPIFSVLLVDDEPLVLEGLAFMIDWEAHGFRICGEACDGEEALARIQELKPDLVVTDIRMPVMDGLRLIEHCVRTLRAPCRFVILSGHDDFDSAQKALSHGVLDFWLKPIDTGEIHAALRRIRSEWPAAASAGSGGIESAPTRQETEWTDTEAGDRLFEAEDRLLHAVELGDPEAIGDASRELCDMLEAVYGGRAEAGKAFLSNVLIELVWKVADGELPQGASAGLGELALPSLPNRPERWLETLAPFAGRAAEQLARQRAEVGPAGEAARYIRAHYREPLQLQTVARELHFQPAYLGQLFKKQFGLSFLDYVHRTRIEEARRLLRRTDLKIAEVARSVGYADPEQFAAKFKLWMDMSPSQYKNG